MAEITNIRPSFDQKLLGQSLQKHKEDLFHSQSTSLFRLDNQQDGKPCFTKIRCCKWKKSSQHSLRQNRNDCSCLIQSFVLALKELNSHCIDAPKCNEFLLCCLRNIFKFDCEWVSGKCKWSVYKRASVLSQK